MLFPVSDFVKMLKIGLRVSLAAVSPIIGTKNFCGRHIEVSASLNVNQKQHVD